MGEAERIRLVIARADYSRAQLVVRYDPTDMNHLTLRRPASIPIPGFALVVRDYWLVRFRILRVIND